MNKFYAGKPMTIELENKIREGLAESGKVRVNDLMCIIKRKFPTVDTHTARNIVKEFKKDAF